MRPIEDVRRDLNTQSEVILLNEHFEDMPQPILEGVARLLELTQELDQELSTQITYQLEELETQERKIDILKAKVKFWQDQDLNTQRNYCNLSERLIMLSDEENIKNGFKASYSDELESERVFIPEGKEKLSEWTRIALNRAHRMNELIGNRKLNKIKRK